LKRKKNRFIFLVKPSLGQLNVLIEHARGWYGIMEFNDEKNDYRNFSRPYNS